MKLSCIKLIFSFLVISCVTVVSFANLAEERTGEIEVMIEDHEKSAKTRYYLKEKSGKRLELVLSKVDNRLQTGAKVKVRGKKTDTYMYLDGSTSSVTVTSSPPLQNTFGDRKLAILLVNFQDNTTQPYAVADGNNVLTQLNNFYKENSWNQTYVTGATFGWFTLPMASTCSDQYIVPAAKDAAAKAGIDLSIYKHIAYVFPRNTSCMWSGVANLNGGTILINGALNLKTVGHELGHNLGLYHSHSLECGSAVLATTGCSVNDYGDALDIMGNSNPGHFNTYQKERLGWLNYGNSPPITIITNSGDYSIMPYETNVSGPKALKIFKGIDSSTGYNMYYYIELRQPIGFDSFITTMINTYGSNVDKGVSIRLVYDNPNKGSQLLDMAPNSTTWDWFDSVLLPGKSYTDSTAGLTITTVSVNSLGSVVNVNLSGAQPQPVCTRANPSISPSSQTKSASAGTLLSYSVTVKNMDSTDCGTSTFSLQGIAPSSSWSMALSSTSVSLAPGASVNLNISLQSSSSIAAGTYSAQVKATNAGASSYASTALLYYSVAAPTATSLVVTTYSDKSIYPLNNTALITVKVVSSTGAAVTGANVSVQMISPSGSIAQLSGTTSTNGFATLSYKIPRKALKGTYQIKANASGQGLTGSASSSFQVQ